jgi:hypothetical protein
MVVWVVLVDLLMPVELVVQLVHRHYQLMPVDLVDLVEVVV